MNAKSSINISIVIPVYLGEHCLNKLIEELLWYFTPSITLLGHSFQISEVLLVHDCGPDNSDATIQSLAKQYPQIRGIWLSRNYGQHPATLAGMASSSGDFVVTMDEDGQQDPSSIPQLLDYAMSHSLQLVYASPSNKPPHGFIRNLFSSLAKSIANKLVGGDISGFNSFRLIEGEIARTLAAYCGNGVYLDIGLFWITQNIGYCPVTLRSEDRPSGYSYKKLIGHFWRLLITTGTRPLRLITTLGILSVFLAVVFSVYAIYGKYFSQTPMQGWTSLLIVTSFFSGCTMISMGLIAEYLATTMGIVMGKPLYVISSKPTRRIKK